MESSVSPVAPASMAPMQRPDLRPTADAAAIARNPQPNVPLPVPSTNSPIGAVNESRMTEGVDKSSVVSGVERVLKPYGVQMLPYTEEGAHQAADSADGTDEDGQDAPSDKSA